MQENFNKLYFREKVLTIKITTKSHFSRNHRQVRQARQVLQAPQAHLRVRKTQQVLMFELVMN
jgi:hypothetical protein